MHLAILSHARLPAWLSGVDLHPRTSVFASPHCCLKRSVYPLNSLYLIGPYRQRWGVGLGAAVGGWAAPSIIDHHWGARTTTIV